MIRRDAVDAALLAADYGDEWGVDPDEFLAELRELGWILRPIHDPTEVGE